MNRARWMAWILMGMGALVFSADTRARTQDPQQEPEQKPDDAPPAKKPPAKKNADNATESAPDQLVWDPLRAEKDLEVGQ